MTNDPEGALRGAIRDPFVWRSDGSDDAPVPWFRYLGAQLPLWTLKAGWYGQFQSGDLPSTYPLGLFIASLLRDDDIEPIRSLPPLIANIDQRRCDLAGGARKLKSLYHPSCFQVGRGLRSRNSELVYRRDPLLSDEDAYHIGYDLACFINALRAAQAGAARKKAQSDLDDFLVRVGAQLEAGRPLEGPSKDALKTLYTEGRSFLALAWGTVESEPSDRTRTALAAVGIESTEQQQLWSARLALPILSAVELRALQAEIKSARTWRKRKMMGKKPTARRFTIWVLAHRLDLGADSIAQKVGAGSDWDYFKGKNPIQR